MSSVLQEKNPMSVQTQQGARFKAGSTVCIEPSMHQNQGKTGDGQKWYLQNKATF